MTTAMFIITSNNKTPQSLRSHSCLHPLRRWNNWWQLTRDGSEVRHQCSLCWNAPVNQQSWFSAPVTWHAGLSSRTESSTSVRGRSLPLQPRSFFWSLYSFSFLSLLLTCSSFLSYPAAAISRWIYCNIGFVREAPSNLFWTSAEDQIARKQLVSSSGHCCFCLIVSIVLLFQICQSKLSVRLVGPGNLAPGPWLKRFFLPGLIAFIYLLIVSNFCCHDRFISEPSVFKIICLQAQAINYCWLANFGPWATCCRPLV